MNSARILHVGAWVLLALAFALAYGNSFPGSFHFDDSHTILSNLYIRDLDHIPRFFSDSQTFSSLPTNQSYRPLLTTSFAIDYWLAGGLHAWSFQLTSVLVLALHAPFLYLLFMHLLESAIPQASTRWKVAFFAVALFVLHTVLAETVNYPSARSDSLSTLLVVISLTMYVCLPRFRSWFLYVVPAMLAVLAKEQAAMLVGILAVYLLLYEYRQLVEFERGKFFGALWRYGVAVVPLTVACAFAFWLTQHMAPKWIPGGSSPWDYFTTQLWVVLTYLLKFFFPFHLSADTDWELIRNAGDERVILGLVIHSALVLWAIFNLRKKAAAPVIFGLAWFYVALIPTSSIVPLAEVTNDHRMFFPFVGLALSVAVLGERVLAWFVTRVSGSARMAEVLASCAVLAILGAHINGVRNRNRVWADEEKLWLDVTQKSPRNARGLMNYGLTKMEKGEYPAAEDYFLRALDLWPRYGTLYVNLGILRGAMGRTQDAESAFKRALELNPDSPASYHYYARWLNQIGRSEEAVPLLQQVLRISAADVGSRQLLIEVSLKLGKIEEAKELARSLLQLDPNNSVAAAVLK